MAKTTEGFAELTQKLLALSSTTTTLATVRTGVGDAMKEVRDIARSRVPIGTRRHKTYKGRVVSPGFAARSLRVLTSSDRRTQSATAVLGVRAEAFYATQFLELGTAKMRARPWLVPSFESSQDEAVKKIADRMRTRIAEIQAKRTR